MTILWDLFIRVLVWVWLSVLVAAVIAVVAAVIVLSAVDKRKSRKDSSSYHEP